MPLDILAGHPEHGLLFVATQVARAAGLNNPTNAVCVFRKGGACRVRLTIGEVFVPYHERLGDLPKASNGRAYHAATALLDEVSVYTMLLRGHAPQSEPFRKWVTEEVLPSLRKSGTYTMPGAPEPKVPALPAPVESHPELPA